MILPFLLVCAVVVLVAVDLARDANFGAGGDGGTPVSPLAREDTRERSLYRPSGPGGKMHQTAKRRPLRPSRTIPPHIRREILAKIIERIK